MQPRIQDMSKDLLPLYIKHAEAMLEAGILFRLTTVVRTHAEQEAFYAQGREPLASVNAKRMTAGMRAIAEKDNVVVTHTKNSRHFPDEEGKAHAYDIAIIKKGDNGVETVTWDLKYDGQSDGRPDYIQAAEIGRRVGLECGAFWDGFKDYPHYQVPRG